jgi:CRISPR-associated endonuclease Csn1
MAYVLGVDGGIASVGWALLDDVGHNIVAAGAWCFDAPENAKDRTPLNAIRREHRGQRRVIRRRRQRMSSIRRLFAEAGLLDEAGANALRYRPGCDPWQLRADALDRPLSGTELALALGHIARHRGFRSNSKRDRGANAPSDTSSMLKAVAATTERLRGRTVAQMAAQEPDWQERKRNRGDFGHTVLRRDLEDETARIFQAQRRRGSPYATQSLQDAYTSIAFNQRPLADSDDKVGPCTHEPSEKRTAKRAPSFEMFRLLARLRNLRLLTASGEVELSAEEIAVLVDGFGKSPKLTFKQLRDRLDLAIGVRFDGVPPAEEKSRDVAARIGGAAEGTHALREALGEPGWRALAGAPEKLDRAAEILTFREDLARIREGLFETGMEPWCAELLFEAARAGKFARFKGAAHVCAKVARAVNRALRRGLAVHDAFAEAGYDPAARRATELKDITNPIARKALGQMIRQVRTVIHEHRHLFGALGLPDRIHVELARDVGKGQDERDEISAGLERRTKEREKLRQELAETFPGYHPGADDLLRYELWKEQGGTCLYTGDHIPLPGVLATDNTYQVDHILPWSRFGDDSFRNKALVSAKANQDKKNRTPFEWLGDDSRRWAEFSARVELCRMMKGGKKAGFYLRRNAAEVEERFRTRNLNDMRYACRILLDTLARLYPPGEREIEGGSQTRHVFARPGSLTAKLRQVWGLEGRKKGPDGKRLPDDRHHALDAIILAACSESLLQRLTDRVKQSEAAGQRRPFADVPEPWPDFRAHAHSALDRVFVARPERRRARGEAHAATISQIGERDGRAVVYERKAVEKLTAKDLLRVKDGAGRNAPMVEALQRWIDAGKPHDTRPTSPQGDEVRKVRLETKDKVNVLVRGGTADRGVMPRVDVFCELRAGKQARFHIVPIYPHQIADPLQTQPPNLAVVQGKTEARWLDVTSFLFMFSLSNNSLVEVVKTDGEIICGYFKGFDRDTAAIKLADPISQQALRTGIGTKMLAAFRKLTIDRLGRVSEVPKETRTWHGVACT